MCSTYAAQEKSKLGKAARQAMRCPHTSGRKGQARVAYELVITIYKFSYFSIFQPFFFHVIGMVASNIFQRRKNPDKEIMRMDVWLETHTKKDGSASCEETVRKT